MVVNTATSAGAIILREIEGELKIALAQHQRTDKTWVLPKGHVEEGETIEEAALREIHEETGLDNVQLIKHLGSFIRRINQEQRRCSTEDNPFLPGLCIRTTTNLLALQISYSLKSAGSNPRIAIELVPYESDQAFLIEHLAPLFT